MKPQLKMYLAALGAYFSRGFGPIQPVRTPFKHKGNRGETREVQARLIEEGRLRRECRRQRIQGMAWSPVDKQREEAKNG